MTRPLLPLQEQTRISAFGLRLRLARERRNISAERMAERVGVPLEMLHAMENGDASIAFADFFRALRVLGLAEDIELLATDDEMQGELLSKKAVPGQGAEFLARDMRELLSKKEQK